MGAPPIHSLGPFQKRRRLNVKAEIILGILIPFFGTIAFSLGFVLMMVLDVALG